MYLTDKLHPPAENIFVQYRDASLLQTDAVLAACQILMVQHPLLFATPAPKGQDRLRHSVLRFPRGRNAACI